uniref:Uncharacterized protein n=1 Tax=Arundo donax TaxID=35708 RepID=A0A0A9BUZ1_ARUDO
MKPLSLHTNCAYCLIYFLYSVIFLCGLLEFHSHAIFLNA